MSITALIVIGLGVLLVLLLIAGLLDVSSRCSRREEAYYRLHPPDAFAMTAKESDGNTATTKQLDCDRTANRCVCCGEIIPEGTQVCANCSSRILPADPWW